MTRGYQQQSRWRHTIVVVFHQSAWRQLLQIIVFDPSMPVSSVNRVGEGKLRDGIPPKVQSHAGNECVNEEISHTPHPWRRRMGGIDTPSWKLVSTVNSGHRRHTNGEGTSNEASGDGKSSYSSLEAVASATANHRARPSKLPACKSCKVVLWRAIPTLASSSAPSTWSETPQLGPRG